MPRAMRACCCQFLRRLDSFTDHEWLVLDDKMPSGCVVTRQLATMLNFPDVDGTASVLKVFKHEVSSRAKPSCREPVLTDGVTNNFLASANVPISARSDSLMRRSVRHRAQVAEMKTDPEVTFVSRHPVSKYFLKRRAEPPLSPHWKRDHTNFECNRDFKGEQRARLAALEHDAVRASCRGKRHALKAVIRQRGSVVTVIIHLCQRLCGRPQTVTFS
jgi:hypothetical protein